MSQVAMRMFLFLPTNRNQAYRLMELTKSLLQVPKYNSNPQSSNVEY